MAPTPVSPDEIEAFLESPQTSKLAKKQLVAFLKDRREIHDTSENYSRDVARRVDKIREIQRRLYRYKPGLTLNLVHVAFLLQLDLRTLDILKPEWVYEIIVAVEPFMVACELIPAMRQRSMY
jgi:hypothetical protein